MADVIRDRMTAVRDEGVVVFLIGMRINRWWKIHRWLPVMIAMPRMMKELSLRLTRTGVALTQQNVTTRFNVIGTATYRLVPLAGGPAVAGGEVRAITGFSAPEAEISSAFAQRAAEQDAEHRLAVELANRILQRLALSAGSWA